MAAEQWRVVFANVQDTLLGEATIAAPEFEFGLNKVGYVNFSLHKSNELARREYIEPYATHFSFYIGDVRIMAGMVTQVEAAGLQTDSIQVACQEWSHYFDRRQYPFDPAIPDEFPFERIQTDVFMVVEDMLDIVLAQPNSLGFTYNNGVLGSEINYRIEPGDTDTMLTKIGSFAEAAPGFDYGCSADREFFMASRAGGDSEYVLEAGRNVYDVTYVDQGILGNHVLGLGSGHVDGRLGKVLDDLPSQLKYHRHDYSEDYGEIKDQALVDNKTQTTLEHAASPVYDMTLKIRPESMEEVLGNIGLGDTPWVLADLGYTLHEHKHRVINIHGSATEQGDIDVTVGLDDA